LTPTPAGPPTPDPYLRHFGLHREPFGLAPGVEHLYLGTQHSEALAGLRIGIRNRRGLITLIGEVGMGKTTLAHAVIQSMDERVLIGYTANTTLRFRDMMKPALVDLGLDDCLGRKPKLIWGLTQLLEIADRRGQIVAIIVDEAHNLSDECFEELRLLLNIETAQAKLLQLILIGQPELDDRLADPHLRHLADRVAVRCVLNPLSPSESREYVKNRLIGAGASLDLFSPKALRLILAEARGVPRGINILCHNSLLFAFGEGRRRVEPQHARTAIEERRGGRLQRFDRRRNWGRIRRTAGLVAAGILLGLLAALVGLRIAGADAVPTSGAPPTTPNATPSTAEALPIERPGAADLDPAGLAAPAETTGAEATRSDAAVGASGGAPSATPSSGSTSAPSQRVVVVERGSSLYRLIMDEYGEYNLGLLEIVMAANPEISDPEIVISGLRVVLPELPAS
jgi:general secretion pathway protein A